jgi:hypothetical protein
VELCANVLLVRLAFQGLPTHDAAGEPLSKGQTKKLVKEQTKQKALFEKHSKAGI